MVALLSNQPMGYYPPRVLVADARRCGVEILPVDINKSLDVYSVEDGAIRISLRQLKGMSEDALNSILNERAKGEFSSLRDFVLRTSTSQPVIENLIKVGAFDSFEDRHELLMQVPKLISLKHKVGRGAVPPRLLSASRSYQPVPGPPP